MSTCISKGMIITFMSNPFFETLSEIHIQVLVFGLMAHIDPVFNLRFLENMGVVLFNKGVSNDRTIHSAAVDTSFDTRLINFYEDQKEVGLRTSISHK